MVRCLPGGARAIHHGRAIRSGYRIRIVVCGCTDGTVVDLQTGVLGVRGIGNRTGLGDPSLNLIDVGSAEGKGCRIARNQIGHRGPHKIDGTGRCRREIRGKGEHSAHWRHSPLDQGVADVNCAVAVGILPELTARHIAVRHSPCGGKVHAHAVDRHRPGAGQLELKESVGERGRGV